jgi:hypothetical protein
MNTVVPKEYSEKELRNMTVTELRKLAKPIDKQSYKWNKEPLIQLLLTDKGKQKMQSDEEPEDTEVTVEHEAGSSSAKPKEQSQSITVSSKDVLEDRLQQMESAMVQLSDTCIKLQKEKMSMELWPDYKFDFARDQHEYDALAQTARVLVSVMDEDMPETTAKGVKRALEVLEERAATVYTGSNENWDTASRVPFKPDSFLAGWTSRIDEARKMANNAKKHKSSLKGRVSEPQFFRTAPHGNGGKDTYQPPTKRFNRYHKNQSKNNKCFVCGDPNHIAKNCPRKFQKKRGKFSGRAESDQTPIQQ